MGFKTAPDATPTSVERGDKSKYFAMMMLIKFHSFVHVQWRFSINLSAQKPFSSFFPLVRANKTNFFFHLDAPPQKKFTVIAGIFIFRKATFSHLNIDIASWCLSNVNRIKLKISERKTETKATDFVEHLPSYRFWSSSSTSEWSSGRSAPDENHSELSVTSLCSRMNYIQQSIYDRSIETLNNILHLKSLWNPVFAFIKHFDLIWSFKKLFN